MPSIKEINEILKGIASASPKAKEVIKRINSPEFKASIAAMQPFVVNKNGQVIKNSYKYQLEKFKKPEVV